MKKLIICFIFAFSFSCFAEEQPRLQMKQGAGIYREEMLELMEKTASACNSSNFGEFMSCFTKKMNQDIRKTMKELFSKHNNTLKMEIISVHPLDAKEDEIRFELEYTWDASDVLHKSFITSIIVAKKEGGSWKVDSEKVKSANHRPKEIANNQNQINFGGGGQVELMPAGDDFLPRDIGKNPNQPSCANGRCQK